MIERDFLQGFRITARAAFAVDFRLDEFGAPSMALECRHIGHIVVEQHRAIARYKRNAHISAHKRRLLIEEVDQIVAIELGFVDIRGEAMGFVGNSVGSTRIKHGIRRGREGGNAHERHRRGCHHNGGRRVMGERAMRERAQAPRALLVFGRWFFLVGNRGYHHRWPTPSGDSPRHAPFRYMRTLRGTPRKASCEAFAHGRRPYGFRQRCCSPIRDRAANRATPRCRDSP